MPRKSCADDLARACVQAQAELRRAGRTLHDEIGSLLAVEIATILLFDVAAFASQNGFEANYPLDPRETIVLITIGAAISNINIVRSGVSLFTRDVTIGGNPATKASASRPATKIASLRFTGTSGVSEADLRGRLRLVDGVWRGDRRIPVLGCPPGVQWEADRVHAVATQLG